MHTQRYWKLVVIVTGLALIAAGVRQRTDSGARAVTAAKAAPQKPSNAVRPPTVSSQGAPSSLWQEPAPVTGRKLTAVGDGVAVAESGRSAPLPPSSGPRLNGVAEGAMIRFPFFDGETLTGLVRLKKQEAGGRTLIGGSLMGPDQGTFSFSEGPNGLAGMILLPARRIALVVQPASTSGAPPTLTEKWLSSVICYPYPTATQTTPIFTELAGAGTEGGAKVVVPILSSRPTADAVLFIDFDGETVTDPAWNGGQTIEAKPATLTTEQIVAVWQRVSEDYVGFNIDITTDVRRYYAAAVGHRMRCIVTPTNTAAPGAGGVAYLNSFAQAGSAFSDTIPCWVFNPGIVGVAEAVAHEFGHTFGLRHDGRISPREEYFLGHGDGPLSWAPIMGAGYYRNVAQWSKGEYASANNVEDDIAVIASPLNGFGFSADEAGGTLATASHVQAASLGELELPGVIQSAADVDIYRFAVPPGRLRFTATPAELSPNLDVSLVLRNEAGDAVVSDNSADAMDAKIDYTTPAGGVFYVEIRGVGHGDPLADGYSSYGSVGAYTITGDIPVGDGIATLPDGIVVSAPRSMPLHYQIHAANSPTTFTANGLPSGLALDESTGVITGIPTALAGSYTVPVTVTNARGTRTGSMTITLTAEPTPLITMGALRLMRTGQPQALSVVASALPNSYAATGLPAGLVIDPITGVISGASTQTGMFRVTLSATNATGTGQRQMTFAVIANGDVVGAGGGHSLLVRGDGTLWTAGFNAFGQLGDGTSDARETPIMVASGVSAVTSGTYSSYFIKTDGTLWGMGANWSGQLGVSGPTSVPVQIAPQASAVAAGYGHSLFVTADGSLWGLGANNSGQLGIGNTTAQNVSVRIDTNVTAIAAISETSAYVRSDGSLWACGYNASGQLGDGTMAARSSPGKIADDVFAVAAGGSFLLFLKNDGSLWRTGLGYWMGVTPAGNESDYLPHQIATDVTKVAAGSATALFTTLDGALWLLGSDGRNILTAPTKITDAAESFAVGEGFIVYSVGNRFWGRGSNHTRALGDGSRIVRNIPVAIDTGVTAIAAGRDHSLWVKQDGSLWGAGRNSSGQLGDGGSEDRGTAVRIAAGVIAAAGGSTHTVFLKTGGEAWGMGRMVDGQNYLSPARLDEDALAIAAGGDFTLWVRPDHTLWGIGENALGALGDGTTVRKGAPVFVGADVAGVSAGGYHALWWTVGGTLWASGLNSSGQLGDGTSDNRLRPVQVAIGVRKAKAAWSHSLFLTTGGELYAMGANDAGQLGDGSRIPRLVPVGVATGVIDFAATDTASYFVKSDGTLWAMGQGFGIDPVRIARGVTAVEGAGEHILILRNDRSLWAMGRNNDGQLGDGAKPFYATTTEIVPGRPAILSSSLPFEASIGSPTTLSVSAIGEGELSYQWRMDGVAIAGATEATYSLAHTRAEDAGTYDVVVSSGTSSTVSDATRLFVSGAAPSFSGTMTMTVPRLQPCNLQIPAENEPIGFTASGLPAGLWLATETGRITGTPTAAIGEYQVAVTATNANGTTAGTLTLAIVASPAPQVVIGHTWVTRRGMACSFAITATGSPLSYAAQNLPAGLAVDTATGAITGSPSATPGLYDAIVTATNEGGTSTAVVRIAVVPEWRDRVAAGEGTSLAIDAQGVLWGAGANTHGQLGDGSTTSRPSTVRIAENVVCVIGGSFRSLFIKADGSLWGMGANWDGALGLGDTLQRNTPIQIDTDVIAAGNGAFHTVYLKSDGRAWMSGVNSFGQFGDGTQKDSASPLPVATGIADVAAGGFHTLFLHRDGTLWTSGDNSVGQLGDGTMQSRILPVQVASHVTTIAATLATSYFIKDDATLWGAGFNGADQIRTTAATDGYLEPTPVKIADGCGAVWGGYNQTLYRTLDGRLWGRGGNGWGQLGDQSQQTSTAPRVIRSDCVFASSGYAHSLFGGADGAVSIVGTNTAGQIADGYDAAQAVPVRVAEDVREIAAGQSFSLVVKSDGSLWGTGLNELGALGDVTRQDRAQLYKVAEGVHRAATGFWHSGFIKHDGTLWMMGNNGDGQLGNGSSSQKGVWQPFRLMSAVSAVSTGGWHTIILKEDKTAWAAGGNIDGQLGDGTNLHRTVPVQVMSGVAKIATGFRHSLFLKEDGTLWATGYNPVGQLGDGSTANRYAPVQVAADVKQIAAGAFHSLFVKTDGTLWGMGYNLYGELGDGTYTDRSTPVQIDSDVVMVSGGSYHSGYIKRDGSIWTMGRGNEGQLGDGGASGVEAAAALSGEAESLIALRQTVAPLENLNLAVRRASWTTAEVNAALAVTMTSCGGATSVGETRGVMAGPAQQGFSLGGPTSNRTRPVRIATGGAALSMGGTHSLYVRRDGRLWAMGGPLYGPLGNGAGLVQWEPRQLRFGVPLIRSQSIPFAIKLGQTVDLSVSAVGNGSLSYQWRKNGEMISGATGPHYLLNGVVAAGGGLYDVVVTNELGSKACTEVNVAVTDAPPVIGGTLVATASRYADDFVYRVIANNDATSYTAEGLPSGLSIDPATGVISGRADAPTGSVQVRLGSTNASGSASATLTIEVTPQSAPAITSARTVLAREGQTFRYPITANNGALGYSAENLPAGLTLDQSTGVISGKVTASAGDYSVSVGAMNSGGSSSAAIKIIVKPAWAGLAADRFSFVVDDQGRLWGTGENSYGQLGDGTFVNRAVPKVVATGVVAVCAAPETGLFLQADGTLWITGRRFHNGDIALVTSPQQMANRVRSFAAGSSYVIFVDWDGTLWAQGFNNEGQLGDGTTTSRDDPVAIATDVEEVAASYLSSFFIKRDHTAWAMGWNDAGQLGDGTTVSKSSPVLVLESVKFASTSIQHTLFLKNDGTVWATGDNYAGQLADGTSERRTVPVQVGTDMQGVWAGSCSLFLSKDGRLFGAGVTRVRSIGGEGVMQKIADEIAGAACGQRHLLAVGRNGKIFAAGENSAGQLGESEFAVSRPRKVAADVARVAGSLNHTLWVTQDGVLWGAGATAWGGRGPDAFSSEPSVVNLMGKASEVAVGAYTSVVLQDNGSVWGMGWNRVGQLGFPSSNGVLSPVQIGTGATAIAANSDCVFYVNSANELWASGENVTGQLGDGTRISRGTFGKAADGVRSVAAGDYHALFLKTDGSLWGAGANTRWQLGISGDSTVAVPIRLAGGVAAAAAGANHSLFVDTGGGLWGLGANASGQLGSGSLLTATSPVQTASGVQSVSAGGDSSYYVGTDGTLWAMGDNSSWQLGDGTQQARLKPVLVATGVSAVSAAPQACFFIKRDRTLWSVGSNSSGRLGIPIIDSRPELQEMVIGAPVVETLSIPIAANLGGTAQLSVTASGVGDFTYQWRKDGVAIAGATSPGYFIGVVSAADGGVYDVEITGSRGRTISNSGPFTVLGAVPVVRSSLAATGRVGDAFEYRILANNDAYKFSAAGLPAGINVDATTGRISGAPTATTGIHAITLSAGNDVGATTAILLLEIAGPPTFPTSPSTQSVAVGASATFSVTVAGWPRPSLLWQVSVDDGAHWSDLAADGHYSGVTTSTLGLSGLSTAWSGFRYRCGATNENGTVFSGSATLTVTGPTFASFVTAAFTPTEQSNSSVSGPSADPDADGLSNLLEYSLGTGPKTNDQGGLPVIGTDSGKLTLTYTKRNDVSDLTYAVEATSDLSSTWSTGANVAEQLSSTAIDATHDRIVVGDLTPLASTNRRFLRLRVALTTGPSEVATPPVGAVVLPTLANSDTLVSVPLARPSVYQDKLTAVNGNVLTVTGTPGWTANQFVKNLPTQASTYYIQFKTGSAAGHFYTVTANAAAALTVDWNGETPGVAAGDQFELIPYWSLAALYPPADAGVSFTNSINAAVRSTELIFPDLTYVGINPPTAATYYFASGAWHKVGAAAATSFSDLVLTPDSYFVQRNKAAASRLTALGTVITGPLATLLSAQGGTAKQDNPIALRFAGTVTLAQSNLVGSGVFQSSVNAALRKDELLVFDNTASGINKSVSATYYYSGGAWRKVGASASADFGTDAVFAPGTGVILRKAGTGAGNPAHDSFWIFMVNP